MSTEHDPLNPLYVDTGFYNALADADREEITWQPAEQPEGSDAAAGMRPESTEPAAAGQTGLGGQGHTEMFIGMVRDMHRGMQAQNEGVMEVLHKMVDRLPASPAPEVPQPRQPRHAQHHAPEPLALAKPEQVRIPTVVVPVHDADLQQKLLAIVQQRSVLTRASAAVPQPSVEPPRYVPEVPRPADDEAHRLAPKILVAFAVAGVALGAFGIVKLEGHHGDVDATAPQPSTSASASPSLKQHKADHVPAAVKPSTSVPSTVAKPKAKAKKQALSSQTPTNVPAAAVPFVYTPPNAAPGDCNVVGPVVTLPAAESPLYLKFKSGDYFPRRSMKASKHMLMMGKTAVSTYLCLEKEDVQVTQTADGSQATVDLGGVFVQTGIKIGNQSVSLPSVTLPSKHAEYSKQQRAIIGDYFDKNKRGSTAAAQIASVGEVVALASAWNSNQPGITQIAEQHIAQVIAAEAAPGQKVNVTFTGALASPVAQFAKNFTTKSIKLGDTTYHNQALQVNSKGQIKYGYLFATQPTVKGKATVQ